MAFGGAGAVIETDEAYGSIATTDQTQRDIAGSASHTEAIVRSYFSDIPVMIQVARCESTFRHTLTDGSVLQGRVDSADTGVMQINKRFHEAKAVELGLDLDDIYDNMTYARYLYEKKGTQPWNASSPCWGRTLAANF